MVFRVVRDQYRKSQLAQQIHASQKVSCRDLAARQQVVHGDFHENHQILALQFGFLQEHRFRALEHVDIDVCRWAEATAFDQDSLFIEHFGGLQHVAVGIEHDGVGEGTAHEV